MLSKKTNMELYQVEALNNGFQYSLIYYWVNSNILLVWKKSAAFNISIAKSFVDINVNFINESMSCTNMKEIVL